MNRTVQTNLIVGGAIVAGLSLDPSGSVPAEQPTVRAVPGQVGLPNPAAAYCEEQGYTLETRTDPDGGQHGVCVFPDGSECDEWAFYRGECSPATLATTATPMSTGKATYIPEIGPTLDIPAGRQQQSGE